MAKTGRPKAEKPQDKRVAFRINNEEYELLLEYAHSNGMTLSEVMKLCIREKLFPKQ